MNISLNGYHAVICGSTQGIGLAIAQELALNGARCTLIARNEGRLKEVVAGLPAAGPSHLHDYAVADFADAASVKQAIDQVISKGPVHILINNTGGPAPGLLTDASPEQLVTAFTQHLFNYQQLVQAVLSGMQKAGYGRIINIVSTSVKIPIANLGVSNTVRAATAGWAKTLSLEVAKDGITVNNILPGYTVTDRLQKLVAANAQKQGIGEKELEEKMKQQIPARRFAEASELAALAAFLASPAASYINGTSIPVDGGSTGAF